MAAQLGMQALISLGEEATAGTPVSRTIAGRINSINPRGSVVREVIPHLYGSGGSAANATDMFDVSKDVQIDVTGPATYQGGIIGMLLKHAMGAVSEGGGGGPTYTHTLTLAGALPAGLTVAVKRGVGGLGDQVLKGCKVSTLALSVQAGAPMTYQATLLGMDFNARTGDTPPALATPYYIKHSHAGQLSFDSANYTLRSFTLRINNNLEAIRELGSLAATEINRSQFQTIEIEAELVMRSDALYAAQTAGTQGDAAITFSDGTNSLAITLHNAVIQSCEDPINGPGYITQRVVWRGLGDGTDHGLGIVLTNGVSTVVGG